MRLSTLRIGSGPRPVLLVHGFLGSGRNLLSLARRWSDADPTHTFLLPDLTGHGTSPQLPPGATLATLAEDLRETAKFEGISEPFDVVGHSLGGRVGLVLRSLPGHPVRRLTLLDIGPGPLDEREYEGLAAARALVEAPEFPRSREEARAALVAHGLVPGIVEWLLTNLVPHGDGYKWRFDRLGLARFRSEVTVGDLWRFVDDPQGIQLVAGGRSGYVPPAEVARIQAAGIRVTTVPDAGHFVHVDQPVPLLAALRAFHD